MSVTDIAAWQRDGFLVVEDFFARSEAEALIARMAEIVAERGAAEAGGVFSTTERSQDSDRTFIESGGRISFFFEAEAEGEAASAATLNKVGHALHDLDPLFSDFSRRPALAALASDLGLAEPRLVQSMYIFKPPRIGGEVVWHQDASFLRTAPLSVVGFWFALEDADRENGCLWAIPGGHREPLRQLYGWQGGRLGMVTLDERPYDLEAAVPLEVPAGTLVVLHGLLPHGSAPNRSERARQAYTLHAVDGRARWLPENWLRRPPDLPFRGF